TRTFEAKMQPREASLSMYLYVFSSLCSAMSMGCVIGKWFNWSKGRILELESTLTISAWSATALDSMTKEGSHPQLHKGDLNDENYKTWISSCITLAALAGSFVSGMSTGAPRRP